MKILFITKSKNDGVFAVRGALPAKWLKKLGHEVVIFEEMEKEATGKELGELLAISDVLVISRNYYSTSEQIKYMIDFAKGRGAKVVYDTDDFLINLSPTHPAYKAMKDFEAQIKMMARNADLMTVTGTPLREAYGKYNSDIRILPNCVDPDEWKTRKGGNKKVRVGWTGSITHIDDLLIIVPVIKELQKTIDFEFVILGMMGQSWEEFKRLEEEDMARAERLYGKLREQGWYTKFKELDKQLSEIRWKHYPFVKIEEYKSALAEMNFDIGLCPLVGTKFDVCKSAIKFYEYSMVGTVTIASKVTPYQEEVNYCAKNRFDKWYSKLKALIENEDLRHQLLMQQRDFVLRNRNIKDRIPLWEEAYGKEEKI